MALTAKELLLELLGEDYFDQQEWDGEFTLIMDKEGIDKVLDILEYDEDDLSEFHTRAGFIKTDNHYFQVLHYHDPSYTKISGYLINDYAQEDGIWMEVGKHHFSMDYEDLCGREHVLKAKLLEPIFHLPSYVD